MISRSAKFGNFITYLRFRICVDYQPTMEIASPTATTPCSTRFFEPATTSTPVLGGAESLRGSKFRGKYRL